MQRRLWPWAILSVLFLATAGCIAPEAAPQDVQTQAALDATLAAFAPPQVVLTDCGGLRGVKCFEPTVAVDEEGRVFVSSGSGLELARSQDGGATFERIATPPHPANAPPGATPGDNTLQVDPQGRLWYSALSYVHGFGTQTLAGLHVARSDDGGASWAVNQYLGLTSLPPTGVLGADRQWVVFGAGDVVYLQYWNFLLGQAYVARSDDGGDTFGAFAPMPGLIPGMGAVDSTGTLHFPTWRGAGADHVIQVVSSADGGATFETRDVHEDSGMVGFILTALTVDADDGIHVAWMGGAKRAWVASSIDGGASWSEPVMWSAGAKLAAAAPFLHAHDGVLDAMWYEQTREGQALVLARAPLAALAAGPTERVVVLELPDHQASTDFAWYALHEGRIHSVATDHARGVLYTQQLATPAAAEPEPAPASGSDATG